MMIIPQPYSVSAPAGPARVFTPGERDVSGPFDRSLVALLPSADAEERRPTCGLMLPDSGVAPVPLTRPRIEVIDPPANRLITLLKTHYPAFEQAQPLPEHVRRAMRLVQQCHTAALGGHVERCPDGHIRRIFYNCCGHRWCPRCAGRQRRKWLLERRAKLLPVRHDHVVFPVSHAFNALWRLNPRLMGDRLFHSATDALRAVLADPRWLGAEPGLTVTLETWDDRLRFHPHLHCVVTGGGLTPEGDWQDVPNPRCLVTGTPLMWESRKQFCRAVKQALEQGELTLPEGTTTRQWLNRLNQANRQKWAVFIAKPPEGGGPTTNDILRYPAEDVAGGPLSAIRLDPAVADLSGTQLRYLTSAPLHETRLVDAPAGQVTFRWGVYDPETGIRERDQTATLSVAMFLRRYLQHVPPPNYQTVRHYGLYASAKHVKYARCRALLADRASSGLPPDSNDTADPDPWMQQHTCPICGKPLMVSGYLPSSVTGRISPRVPIGHVFAPWSSLGGGHDP